MTSPLQLLVLGGNVLWFGLGFSFFTLRAPTAVRLLVPRSAREEASVRTLVASMPFLGGMNLAFAVLSASSFVASLRSHPTGLGHVFGASAVAHGTQWVTNLPHALRGGRGGGAPWDVLRGTMLLIFVCDGACALLNLAALLT